MPQELEPLLSGFLAFYNDRPHQGAELNGLSPMSIPVDWLLIQLVNEHNKILAFFTILRLSAQLLR